MEMDLEITCVLCGSDVTDEDVSNVREKGMLTLHEVSSIRQDGVSEKIGDLDCIKVHSSCRKSYTSVTHLEPFKRRAPIDDCNENGEKRLCTNTDVNQWQIPDEPAADDCFQNSEDRLHSKDVNQWEMADSFPTENCFESNEDGSRSKNANQWEMSDASATQVCFENSENNTLHSQDLNQWETNNVVSTADCPMNNEDRMNSENVNPSETNDASLVGDKCISENNETVPVLYDRYCIICGEGIPEDFEKKQNTRAKRLRQSIVKAKGTRLCETLTKKSHERDDEWGRAVLERVEKAQDEKSDIFYHEKCFPYYCASTARIVQVRNSEPSRLIKIQEAMANIYKFLDKEDECQFTMSQLMEAAGEYKPEVWTLKKHLMNHYGPANINITAVKGKEPVISLSTVGSPVVETVLKPYLPPLTMPKSSISKPKPPAISPKPKPQSATTPKEKPESDATPKEKSQPVITPKKRPQRVIPPKEKLQPSITVPKQKSQSIISSKHKLQPVITPKEKPCRTIALKEKSIPPVKIVLKERRNPPRILSSQSEKPRKEKLFPIPSEKSRKEKPLVVPSGKKKKEKSVNAQNSGKTKQERMAIILEAANIIHEDICANLDSIVDAYPDTLHAFLRGVIMKDKKKSSDESLNRKCSAIGHSIIACTEPVSSDSPSVPEQLSCSCTEGCRRTNCCCAKAGTRCSKRCKQCVGEQCHYTSYYDDDDSVDGVGSSSEDEQSNDEEENQFNNDIDDDSESPNENGESDEEWGVS